MVARSLIKYQASYASEDSDLGTQIHPVEAASQDTTVTFTGFNGVVAINTAPTDPYTNPIPALNGSSVRRFGLHARRAHLKCITAGAPFVLGSRTNVVIFQPDTLAAVQSPGGCTAKFAGGDAVFSVTFSPERVIPGNTAVLST